VLLESKELLIPDMDDQDLRGDQGDVFTRLADLEKRCRTHRRSMIMAQWGIRKNTSWTAERERVRKEIRAFRWLAEVLLPPHRLVSKIARFELGTPTRYTQVRIHVLRAAREVFGIPGKNKVELQAYCPSLIEGGGVNDDDRRRALCVLGLQQTPKSKWSYWRLKKKEEMEFLKKLLLARKTRGRRRTARSYAPCVLSAISSK
jgi:hypothetical protein